MKTNKYPFVSVIILNLNGQKFIPACLSSLKKTKYPKFEIIFVDNGSSDQSLLEAEKYLKSFSNKQILSTKKNIGWSAGNNFGIKRAKGEAIVLLSNDTEVEPNWLKELIKVLYADKKIGIVQGQSFSIYDRKSLDSGKNYVDIFGFCYSERPTGIPEEVFFAEGVSMAVKKEVFEKIGLLDEDFFIMYDDIDFSWRARLAGYKIMIAPRSIVFHYRGGTVGEGILKIRPKIVYLNTRNHLTSLLKNYSLKNIFILLPWVYLAQFIKCFLFAFIHRKFWAAGAVILGLLSLNKDTVKIIKKRRAVQKTRKVSDKEIKKAMVKFRPLLLARVFRTREALGIENLKRKG